jgi:polysaccharide export outer membrane protein
VNYRQTWVKPDDRRAEEERESVGGENMQTDSKQSPGLECGGLWNSAFGHRSRGASVVALGFVLSVALGCATPAPPPKPGPFAPYRVGAPDQLLVTILPDPVIERTVVVRPDGMITIDLLGDVPAAGLTAEEIARDLETRIARFKRSAKATVSLISANSTAVTVLGEVRRPSSFPLVKNTRVVDAIGQVADVTSLASKGRIRVIRPRGGEIEVYRVDLKAIERGDLSTNIMLAKGDIVYVPPTIWARVGYAFQTVLFPFQPLLGVAGSAAKWGAF